MSTVHTPRGKLTQPSGPSNIPAPDKVVPCCWASAETDGAECTCWVAVLDVEPTTDVQEGPPLARRRMCGDCAYRPGSPERQELGGDEPWYGLEQPFFCHTGMPRAVAYQHPTLPEPVPAPDDGDYRPYIRDGRPWQADGRPAELCAGWAAFNRARYRLPGTPPGRRCRCGKAAQPGDVYCADCQVTPGPIEPAR